ncbi:MAG TPA: hypothetical protein H9870_08560 [Candidatus Corynebacterium avicola]|uniref:Uncharacterized protein n=1 Tax=Candidatus Corynebacterium avicola TaxID=2838527 RepID=A0A9D1UM80_9CORY|nr:hypothetical protein [Candidatus Corynebacterium avicola]
MDKNHFSPTTLKNVETRDGGAQHISSVVLNNFVGGLNPLAVDIAARAGAGVVWLPTVDVEMTPGTVPKPLSGSPSSWSAVRDEIMERGLNRHVDPILDGGAPSRELLAVLEVVRDYGLTVATGHLRFPETLAAVRAAKKLGIDNIIVTHPEFPSQHFSDDQKLVLVESGGTLEYCYTTAASGKTSWKQWLHGIATVSPEHVVISSDAGQPANPPVEDCIALAADRLLQEGFADSDIRTMTVTASRRLINT